jgi:hypothetical protein
VSTDDKPRILWIHPGGLLPVGGGGAARTWALIDCLRERGYAVELATCDQGIFNDGLESRTDRLWIRNRIQPGTGAQGRRRLLKDRLKAAYRNIDPGLRLLRRLPGKWHVSESTAANLLLRNRRRALEQYAGEIAYAAPPLAAIASYTWLAPALDHMPPGTLRIIDTIDIQHERRDAAAAAGGNLEHVMCTREQERQELNRADVLLAIQAIEKATLESMCPDREVILTEHAHQVADYVPSPAHSRNILYIGNRYDPNVLGLRAILERVWPALRKACPSASLTVCGRVCEAFRKPVPGVNFAGQVADLAPYYTEAAVVLNPVPYGTGLKIKTVEGLAQGRCVVCTEAGTGGLGDPTALPLVIAEPGGEMVMQIMRLLQSSDERHMLERRAWDFARDRFSAERVYGPLLARLENHRTKCESRGA